jgi:hypothetical protein
MAGSRFQEEMDDWNDQPGSVEALLHVDAQLHDDPLGYTSWEASGPLARLLGAVTAAEVSGNEDAEARAVAGFSVARALDDENFYGRTRKPAKQRRALSQAALAGALAAGVLAATSGLAAAAHTSVAKVVSDIANGLGSSEPTHVQTPRPGIPPTTTPNPSIGTVAGPASATPPATTTGTTGSCASGTDRSASGRESDNAACGTVSHGSGGKSVPSASGHRGKPSKSPSKVRGAGGSGTAAKGKAVNLGSGSGRRVVGGSGSGSHGSMSNRSGSAGGSVSGTGHGSGSGTNPVGHPHRHHHHHGQKHVVDVGESLSGGQ